MSFEIEGNGYSEDQSVPPLDKQELEILESMKAAALQGEESFAKWKRKTGNRVPEAAIKFTAKIRGELVENFMFLQYVIGDGYKLLTTKDIARHIVEMGIKALLDKVMESRMQAVLRACTLTGLPPEIRDAVLTAEARKALRGYLKTLSTNSGLADVLEEPDEKSMPATPKVCALCPGCNKPLSHTDEDDSVVDFKGEKWHANCLINKHTKQG